LAASSNSLAALIGFFEPPLRFLKRIFHAGADPSDRAKASSPVPDIINLKPRSS
jgi:hypothetical protein